ncbi:MAG: AsmA family protein [Devosia sp.]|uniref:AsmA family protein n=1 Tax=Devosia sp. TaxID=1871048 RepID=UPI001ACB1834|nr:AsmA-like C-terminal region-containing protein [Devosia sp.]MBN9315988.1 AsmA family protein [Devosia sp.]
MLNRLFIIVGVVAILAIVAAFVVPSFIPWGAYRDRLATIAAEALGTPVRIKGEVSFSLLPQPRLKLADVSAGPEQAPNLKVESVEADFSLIDFLRDRYNVTRLVLGHPTVTINVGEDGSIDTGLALAKAVESNIAIANAAISGGRVELNDHRTGQTYQATDVTGDVKLEALHGPFSFQGSGTVDGAGYALRVATGPLDAAGGGALTLNLRPADGSFTLSAEGTITPGLKPDFAGTATWRQPPRKTESATEADAGQGDLVMTSKVVATPSRLLLSDYVVVPDENRAATRLLGAAEVTLGPDMSFNAVISGGVLALPPRDATAEAAVEPYELLRLLRELPLPTVPGIPGTIGVDIAELNLRAFSLRNVRLDARAHDGNWTVTRFAGALPGDTSVMLSGEVSTTTGRPEFAGRLSVVSQRLDALSTLWRKPAAGNPLFGMPGGIDARIDLVGDTLSISDATLDLDSERRSFSAQIGLGARDLHLTANLGTLDAARSAALLALLPDLGSDASFAASFTKGEFKLAAEAMTIGGLEGRSLEAAGSWDGGVLALDRLAAADLGGAAFDAKLTAFGSLARPEVSGGATISVASADAPALKALYGALRTSPAMVAFLSRSLPAELRLQLDAPTGDGAQSLTLSGRLASSAISAEAQVGAGFLRALSGPVKVRLDLKSNDTAAMTAQLGFGTAAVFIDGVPLHLVGVVDGNVANSLEATMLLEGGGDALGFSGNMVVTNPDAFSGKGTVKAKFADASGLVAWLGAGGISLPALSASGTLTFDGTQAVAVSDITGTSGEQSFKGKLNLSQRGTNRSITGTLDLGKVEVGALMRTLLGPASQLPGPGAWPDGPLATGDVARSTVGRIGVTASGLEVAGAEVATDLHFDLDWDATNTRLRNAGASIGQGSASLELSVCCAGPLSDKQVSGRIALAGVPLDRIVPTAVAAALEGTIDASGRFDGTGDSIAGVLGAMTGEGTYSVSGLRIERFDPQAPSTIAAVEDLLAMQPEQLTALIEERLEDGPFASPKVAGSFTIAGGVLRSPNVPMEGDGGQLFGSGSIRLVDLGIGGDYTLTPTSITPAALVDAGSARVVARLGGTLVAPERTFDVSGLVDAIMVKAYEAEVARLEKLRAEDEARKQAEEAEKARLAAEAAAVKAADDAAAIRAADEAAAEKLAAEEAAKKAAEAEAAKKAADEAAAKKAADDAAAQQLAIKKALEELNKPMDIGFGN